MGKLFEKARFISILGIVSLLIASIATFLWGAVRTVYALIENITSLGQDPYIAISLIELVENFLIATALFVFAAIMYELFIGDINLPKWMLAHNLHELKEKLGGVIILVMVVKFVEYMMEWKNPVDSLYFAISVTLVSGVLIALGRFGGNE